MFSFFGLLVVMVTTFYIGMIYNNEAILLLMFMEATVFVMSFIWLIYRKKTVKARIAIPISISEVNKESIIRINIANNGILPIMRMKAYVKVYDTIRKTKKKMWMTISATHDKDTWFEQLVRFDNSGDYEIWLEKLRVYDITGFFYTHIKVKDFEKIQVLPRIYSVPVKLTLATKNFYGEADSYDVDNPGFDNTELFKIREYQPGDRLSNVHWKMTAKQDELMVKEDSLPKSCPVVLFIDADINKGKKNHKKLLAFNDIMVSLSFSMIDAGCPHYIAWLDAEDNDVHRIRVDNEESLFYFLSTMMRIRWKKEQDGLEHEYRQRYRGENYAYALFLDENLVLKKGDELVAEIDAGNLKDSLEKIELLL